MKNIIALICSMIVIGMFGCSDNKKSDLPAVKTNTTAVTKIEDTNIEQFNNLEKSLKSKIESIESLDVKDNTVTINMKYLDKNSTMKEMVTAELMAENFLKIHSIDTIIFSTDNGYVKLELKNDSYEIVDATLC